MTYGHIRPEIESEAGRKIANKYDRLQFKKSNKIPSMCRTGAKKIPDDVMIGAILKVLEGNCQLVNEVAEEIRVCPEYLYSVLIGQVRRKAWIAAEKEFVKKHKRYPEMKLGGSR